MTGRSPTRCAPASMAGTIATTCRWCAACSAPTPAVADFLPVGNAPYFLQDWYIVDNPHLPDRRKLLDDAGDGSRYSAVHAVYHPLMRSSAATLGFSDLLMVEPRTGRILYTVDKAADSVPP